MSKKKPILLVDCDGVLADLTMLIDALNVVMKSEIDLQKCEKYHLHEIWGTSVETMSNAMDEIDSFFSYEDIEPVTDSIISVNSLRKFFEIKILTARKPQHERQTENWIKIHFGPGIEIIYAKANANKHGNNASKTKIEICKDLKAFALIEDNPYELEELVKQTPNTLAVCLELRFNQHLKSNPKIFVGDWTKITNFLLLQNQTLAKKN